MIGQYFKAKENELVIYVANPSTAVGYLRGMVVIPNENHKLGKVSEYWHISEFEPCEAPQGTETTKADPIPANDTQMRLECMKLAVALANGNGGATASPTIEQAQDFYDWITQKETKPNIE